MRPSHLLMAGALVAFTVQARASDGFVHWNRLHIQVPVVLKQAKVVFNMDHLAFIPHTREPVGLAQMHMMVERFNHHHTRWKIDGIFQGAAAYMVLNNKAYDRYMHVHTGNPYRGQIARLIRQGVDIEACGVTMRAHHWGNKQLLPNVKVNGGALARIVQLVQRGYVQIQP